MDTASIQLQPYRPNPNTVPPEIHRSLLNIATHGYDADDVMTWYLIVKRELHEINAANADTSYSLTPPFSVCSPAPPDTETQTLSSPLEANLGPPTYYTTPTHNPTNLWSDSFAFNTLQTNHNNATTSASDVPLQLCTTSADISNSLLPLSSPWSATASTFPTIPTNTIPAHLSAANFYPYPPLINQPQFHNPDPFSTINHGSRKRRASQPPPYYSTIGGPPVTPLLPPFEPTIQTNNSIFPPMTASNEIAYSVPISVVPSRKRRKTLPKGMKKVIQAVQLQRQS